MMQVDGVTTTKAPGQEQYEECRIAGRNVVQYDYRDLDGKLFSIVAPTVEIARARRDTWLAKKNA